MSKDSTVVLTRKVRAAVTTSAHLVAYGHQLRCSIAVPRFVHINKWVSWQLGTVKE